MNDIRNIILYFGVAEDNVIIKYGLMGVLHKRKTYQKFLNKLIILFDAKMIKMRIKRKITQIIVSSKYYVYLYK